MTLECPECGSSMELKPSKFGQDRMYYACTVEGCPGAHGAHPDGTPLGKPADQATKRMRIAAHAEFDKLWQSGNMKRKQAYAWMQRALGMTSDEAHIGNFDSATCTRLIKAVWVKFELEALPNDDSILPDEWR